MPFDFQKKTPESLGIRSKDILTFLDRLQEKHVELHSLVLLRHGDLAAEGWFAPYRQELPHVLYSLSKSFTSTAIGFAIQEGLLSLEDFVVSFFPEKLPGRPCENMEAMQIRHLLTMSTGHEEEPGIIGTEDWVETFLTSYVPHKPGTHFLYNTPATYMLSAILQKVTGISVEEYLIPRLFEPLGIQEHRWEVCPKGITTGGFGLNLKTRDIARFGQFLLQEGKWEGRQLLDPQWIREATAFQVQSAWEKDWGCGYGYQFWRCVPGQGIYRADGMHGQICVVFPEQDAVLAATAGTNGQTELDCVWEKLLPAFQDHPLPEDPSGLAQLEERLSSLSLPLPEGEAHHSQEAEFSGRLYELSSNFLGLTALSFTFGQKPSVTFYAGEAKACMPIGLGCWKESLAFTKLDDVHTFQPVGFERAALAGAWDGDTFCLKMISNTTPYTDLFRISFEGNALVVEHQRPLNPFSTSQERILGVCHL